MGSLSESRDRNPYQTIGVVCARLYEGRSREEIAKELRFDSVEDMRDQLQSWNLPDFIVGAKANSSKKSTHKKSTPRLRNIGSAKALPPLGNATNLFKERLEALLESAELLKHMDESLRGRYFVRQDVETASVLFPWEHLSEEGRAAIREQRGPDFEGDLSDTSAIAKFPGGVALSPPDTEAILIAVYALANGDMDALLDVLHLDSSSVGAEAREEIRQYVEGSRADGDGRDGLKVLARQLAIWVRGSEVRPGRPSTLSPTDHAAACAITHYRKQGLTDEEIARKFSHPLLPHKKEDGTSYTIEDIAELGDLGLSWL
jgi:hypothetical protein